MGALSHKSRNFSTSSEVGDVERARGGMQTLANALAAANGGVGRIDELMGDADGGSRLRTLTGVITGLDERKGEGIIAGAIAAAAAERVIHYLNAAKAAGAGTCNEPAGKG